MSSLIEQWMMGDPMSVAMRREAEAQRAHSRCGDCIHKRSTQVRRETVFKCVFSRRTYGIRCDLYKRDLWESDK
jgi:hypothetical protein